VRASTVGGIAHERELQQCPVRASRLVVGEYAARPITNPIHFPCLPVSPLARSHTRGGKLPPSSIISHCLPLSATHESYTSFTPQLSSLGDTPARDDRSTTISQQLDFADAYAGEQRGVGFAGAEEEVEFGAFVTNTHSPPTANQRPLTTDH
jgi:hypothetical protein